MKIYTNNDAHVWAFDNEGNLNAPILKFTSSGIITTQSGVSDIYIDPNNSELCYIAMPTFHDGGEKITIKNQFPNGNGVDIVTNGGIWFFGDDGNLNLPGNLIGSGASPSPIINGFDSISLNGTGTVVNASAGNILTNEVTGTKFNFLNGSYTATLTGGGATSTYTLNLPANAGTNGQVLSTDGAGNLSWIGNLVQWVTAPVANTSAGTAGQAAYDTGGNLFVCVSTNTWAKFSGTTSW